MRPKGKLLSLEKKFIRVRVVDMTGVDIGLFDFDFDTTFHAFVLNHEERIYLRYGGRAGGAPNEYLSTKGLAAALQQGLAMHEQWKAGELPAVERPAPKLTNSYANVAKIVEKGECVHCHHVAAARSEELMKGADFEPQRDVWLYPDTRRLGIELSATQGLEVQRVSGAARAAGLREGDEITRLGTTNVTTYGDLQRALHLLPADAAETMLTVAGEGAEGGNELTVELPRNWRVTDINWRSIGHKLEPFPGFWAESLTAQQRKKRGFDPDGFASEVGKFWTPTPSKAAGMKKGDIVYEVSGVRASPLATNVMIYIRLHHQVGEEIEVKVLRGKKKMVFEFTLTARSR